MNYYCIMVKTGGEEEFKADALEKCAPYAQGLQFWFFKRKMKLGGRHKGQVVDTPLFPGYVFMSALGIDQHFVERIRTAKHFYHFLSSNRNIIPLYGKDLESLHCLISHGETSGFSLARFDENDRIVVVSGLLQGFTGNIIRVNRRKQRVTVRMDMCGSINTMDLCYDLITKAPERA